MLLCNIMCTLPAGKKDAMLDMEKGSLHAENMKGSGQDGLQQPLSVGGHMASWGALGHLKTDTDRKQFFPHHFIRFVVQILPP